MEQTNTPRQIKTLPSEKKHFFSIKRKTSNSKQGNLNPFQSITNLSKYDSNSKFLKTNLSTKILKNYGNIQQNYK